MLRGRGPLMWLRVLGTMRCVRGLSRERAPRDVPAEGNPVGQVRHQSHGVSGECLGVALMLWCPGCQTLHSPVFRCPEHGGPAAGPVWDGDPWASPLTVVGSYLVFETPPQPRCHAYIHRGSWQFLTDCTHDLAGTTVPLEPLPDWLVGEEWVRP